MKTRLFSILVLLFVSLAFAEIIEFEVPEGHPKHDLIEGLYNDMTEAEEERSILEREAIKQQDIRGESLEVQEQYLEYALTNGFVTNPLALEYLQAVKTYYQSRVLYFQEMLTVVEDNRARCFLFYKAARTHLSEATMLIARFTPDEPQTIEYAAPQKITLPN